MISEKWKIAFAKQSASDLKIYVYFCQAPGLPVCHKLHYLQMHLEKICKAYLWDHWDQPLVPEFHRTHNIIAKVLPRVIKETWRETGVTNKPTSDKINRIRELCREIDLLSPAVDDGGRRPDNCEYPWQSFRNNEPVMLIPANEPFQIDQRLRNNDGKLLLKTASYLCQKLSIEEE